MMWRAASALAGLPGLPTCPKRCRETLDRLGTARRERTAKGGGFEYLVTDLPEPTQQAIAAQAAGAIRPVLNAMAAGERRSQVAQIQAHANAMAKIGHLLEQRGAFDPARNPRLDLFQRFEAYYLARGIDKVWPCINEFCQLWDAGEIDALASTRLAYPKMPPKTLDKWFRAWRLNGVEALQERKTRKDKGVTALVQDENLYQAFVAAVVEMHDPTAAQVQRIIRNQVGPDRTPPISTLNRWLADFKAKNKVALLKLKNPDGWRNKYMPAFGSRSEHINRPNEEWQLDSTIADAQQRVEVAFNLTDSDTGEIRRHALVAGIDVFTRRVKVFVARTSSSNAVKTMSRMAMRDFGMWERTKTDNGKDYTAKDFDFALQALGVKHILCTPFSPDQKPFIERFFGTLLHDLFPMLAGFVGHDMATRKAIESAKSFAQRFGDRGVDLRMSPEQLQGVINGWVDEYHNRRHSELGCSPNEMAERHVTSIVRVDERALDMFLMPVAGSGIRTVGKRGISMPLADSIGTAWYAAPELASVDVMGQQVYCRIDEADLGAMHVFRLDGEYICRALDHSRLGINRGELAAKAKAIHASSIKPQIADFKRSKEKGLTAQTVQAIYAERQDAAIEHASNVTRLQPRIEQASTPATESVVKALQPQHTAARELARATLADAEPAPVLRLDTPKQRYSTWVRLQVRMQAGEQLGAKDLHWSNNYQGSNEFEALHALHEGQDPLQEAAG